MFDINVFQSRLEKLKKEDAREEKRVGLAPPISTDLRQSLDIKDKVPTIDNLFCLADFFGVSLDYLTGYSDEPGIYEEVYEEIMLSRLPDELLPAYQAAKEKNPENLPQIIETFEKITEDYHSLTK